MLGQHRLVRSRVCIRGKYDLLSEYRSRLQRGVAHNLVREHRCVGRRVCIRREHELVGVVVGRHEGGGLVDSFSYRCRCCQWCRLELLLGF